jgi:RNA polymerase sigma factor (sigma-70 family)
VRGWLLTIAANEARQIARRNRRVTVVELDTDIEAAPRTDPATGIDRLDLVQVLNGLSPDDRALLALRYVAGVDAPELGSMTGRSASGTRARLSRLTARLRKELGDD